MYCNFIMYLCTAKVIGYLFIVNVVKNSPILTLDRSKFRPKVIKSKVL